MASEVEKFKESLSQKNRQLDQAAKYGIQLLEENNILKKQKSDYETSLEDLRQKIHTLVGRLEFKCRVQEEQASELENTKDMVEKLQKKLENHEAEIQRKSKELLQIKEQFSTEQSEKISESLALSKKIEVLENRLAEDSNNLQKSFIADSFTDSFENKLVTENQILLDSKIKLEANLFDLEKELHLSREQLKKSQKEQEENEEALADRDKELSDFSVQMRKVRLENDELQAEVESLKMEQIDVKKRGNSLFSEVEDNRKVLENEVKTLRTQNRTFIQNEEFNVHEITKLKHQITLLLNMTSSQPADKQYVQQLQQALSQARGEVQELSLKLLQSEEKQKSGGNSSISPVAIKPLPSASNFKEQPYDFLHTIMGEKDEKISQLQSQVDSIRLAKASMSNQIMQSEKQLYQANQKVNTLQAELLKMKFELSESQSKDKVLQKLIPKTITVVERIPGFKLQTQPTAIPAASANESQKTSVSRTMQELAKKENEASKTTGNKENVPQALPIYPTNIGENLSKAQAKKVTIAETVSEREGPVEEESSRKSRRALRNGGRKVDIQIIEVTNDDAIEPADCKQQ